MFDSGVTQLAGERAASAKVCMNRKDEAGPSSHITGTVVFWPPPGDQAVTETPFELDCDDWLLFWVNCWNPCCNVANVL